MHYRVISTDDHLQEAPDTWTSRMSAAKWGDKIPHLGPLDRERETWFVYGEPNQRLGVAIVHGALPDRAKSVKRWEDVPRIAYVPEERVKAMDQDGVDAHTLFGNIAGVAGGTFSNPSFEEAFRLEAIRAFNDFQIEAYSRPFPGRFITLAIVPLWSAAAAVAEVERTHALGIHGVSFAFPQQFGYPHICDPHWDPLWRICEETGLSLNLHIGSGGSMGIGTSSDFSGHSEMRWLAEASTRSIVANTQVMSTILFSGILERFPALKVVSSESGLGWVPYLLETADHQWERQKLWREGMSIRPSEYFRRQCYVNFWFEKTGIENRHLIGVDNIMWESDFPHPTCSWPNSREFIARSLDGIPADERRRILVDNAVRVFNLQAD